MQKHSSLRKILEASLRKAKPSLPDPIHPQAHLAFEYGMDSLEYEKLFYILEEEFQLEIPKDIRRSGFFASLEGIETLLREEYKLQD